MNPKSAKRLFFLSLILLGVFLTLTLYDHDQATGWLLVIGLVVMAISFRGFQRLKGFSYAMVIFASVSLAMYQPQYFIRFGSIESKLLITPLLQVIMFGMGTALSWQDFARVIKMPQAVFVGIICQFSIMPLVGWVIAHFFALPKEIAAGIILVGCCPSGLASNVMTYLAKANLALSVTLTAIATLLAPIMTPFLMQHLAGEFIETDYFKMMWDITKMVILPIGMGLIFHHLLQKRFQMLDRIMPLISMAGIAIIVVIIVSRGRDNLIEVGLLLILATFIHNSVGYTLGYGVCKILRMPEQDCRTISLEVGMQNGGLATSIATDTLKKAATIGLAPAVFGSLMNVTGSVLGLFWRSKPIRDELLTDDSKG